MTDGLVILGANADIGRALVTAAIANPRRRVVGVSRSAAAPSGIEPNNLVRLGDVDLTVERDLRRMSEVIESAVEGSFGVVHAVGDFWHHVPFLQIGLDEARRMFDSHVITLLGAARALLPLMVDRGGGRFVAFSCNSVRYAYPDMSPFTAAKAAIEALIRGWANELSGQNITTVALALPTIMTDKVLASKHLSGDEAAYLNPAEVAQTVLDLVLNFPVTMSGNTLSLFRHNDAFYRTSYYERNPVESGLATDPDAPGGDADLQG